ncbi:beta-lactamase family protein [Candidatus Sumerlaeota bacterium]|nr:beta-lactamase family protein [Candidatus Sumerlaeota bacterium]
MRRSVLPGTLLSLILLTLAAPPAQEAPAWVAELSERFATEVPVALERESIPGAVVLVGHLEGDEWVTWCEAYGNIQIEPEVRPMPVDAIFDMASVTKPVATGTSIMILQDRGLLSVDDLVSQHLIECDTDEKRDIRIRDLMTHSSGLPAYIGAAAQAPIIEEFGYPCPDALQDVILNIPLQYSPNSATVYSCLNAITCAQIVERVSGQPLDEFAAENIFEPLGMIDTSFSPGPGPRVVPTTVGSHSSGEFLCGMVHDPLANIQAGVSGNAGLFSTAQDLSIFAQMMLQGGERDGVRILSEEAVGQMTSEQLPSDVRTTRGGVAHRGLLWQIAVGGPGDRGMETIPAYTHTGYTGTAIRIWPSENFYVIALTNRVHPDDTSEVAAFRQLCWRVPGEIALGIDTSTQVLKPLGDALATP